MLAMLSERQTGQSFEERNSEFFVTFEGVELTTLLLNVLSVAPKTPISGKLVENEFFADADRLVCDLRENTDDEGSCETDSSAKNELETSIDRGVKKIHDLLKKQKLLAAPFDKG